MGGAPVGSREPNPRAGRGGPHGFRGEGKSHGGHPPGTPFPGARSPLEEAQRDIFLRILRVGEAGWGAHLAPTPEARKRELAEGEDYVPGHGLGPLAPAPATMTSLPCPVPGPDPSKAIFPNIAPVPSVVAAYQLGLSPATAAASDLPYSGPYGHLLPYPYAGPATPRDSYLPCQQPAAPSQPAQQEREAGAARTLALALGASFLGSQDPSEWELPEGKNCVSHHLAHGGSGVRKERGARLREAAAVPGALGAAPAGPDQKAAQAEDHLLEPAAAAAEPAFPAHAVPGAAREGSAGGAARPHPDPGSWRAKAEAQWTSRVFELTTVGSRPPTFPGGQPIAP
ncbi:homeobox protein DLX-4 isoform X1 [Equus przewalskii]|uniref:Homeobox protein DLX-4 isoform X1 n=1 Tax=Equus przewalskii TaxID=9798 RepID=A0ABM4JLE7_EQUPR